MCHVSPPNHLKPPFSCIMVIHQTLSTPTVSPSLSSASSTSLASIAPSPWKTQWWHVGLELQKFIFLSQNNKWVVFGPQHDPLQFTNTHDEIKQGHVLIVWKWGAKPLNQFQISLKYKKIWVFFIFLLLLLGS